MYITGKKLINICINNWKGNLARVLNHPFSLNTENPFVAPQVTDTHAQIHTWLYNLCTEY